MRIFIPTYKRPDDQKTWHTLAPELRDLVTFVVRPEEADYFRLTYSPSLVEVLPPNRQNGYIGAMQHILDIADDIAIYMDDDITSFHRKLRFFPDITDEQKDRVMQSRWTGEALTAAEQQAEMLDALIEQVGRPWVASCSPRPPHIPPLDRMIRVDGTLTAMHTVMMAALNIARIKAAGICWDDGSNNAISDALFNLRLLEQGLDCRYDCRYGFTAIPMFGGKGGIQFTDTNRVQRVIDAHHELHALFPTVLKPKARMTPVKDGYPEIPYRFYRQQFLQKCRTALNIVVVEDDTRLDPEYAAHL